LFEINKQLAAFQSWTLLQKYLEMSAPYSLKVELDLQHLLLLVQSSMIACLFDAWNFKIQ